MEILDGNFTMKLKLFLKVYDGLVSINPYDIKLYAFMQLYNIDFELEYSTDLSQSPNKQSPYIIDNEKILGDSQTIINYLIEKYKIKEEINLTEEQHATVTILNELLEKKLFRIIYYSRLFDTDGWPQFKDDNFALISEKAQQQMIAFREKFSDQFGDDLQKCREELYEQADEIFNQIEKLFENNPYLSGKQAHAIDTTVYAFLASISKVPFTTGLQKRLFEHEKLLNFIERMDEDIKDTTSYTVTHTND